MDKKFQLIEGQREGPKSKQLEVKVLMPDNTKKWVKIVFLLSDIGIPLKYKFSMENLGCIP